MAETSGAFERRHVGLLIPSSNTTIEHEYNRFGPPEIDWHVGRLTLTEVSPQGLTQQEPDIAREAAKLATAHPSLMVLCQSAVGFVAGEDYERTTMAHIRAISGVIALSAASLMLGALRALGARHIALATPFASGVDEAAAAYFTRAGLSLRRTAALGMTGNYGIAAVSTERLIALARAADGPEVDAIVIPGGNLQAMSVLPHIEAALAKPVVITNQACIWAIAGLLGVAIGPAYGRLAQTDADGALRRALRQ